MEIADREAVLKLNRGAIARDYQRQAAKLDQMAGHEGGTMPEDDTEFNVDSPRTIHNHLSPTQQQSQWPAIIAAAGMALGGLGAGAGLSAWMMNRPATPPAIDQPADGDTNTLYRVELE